ncbi:MAG: ABC transporter ATP-binding protein [Anaerolineae bacterium]|nr:ABC transporter ATP-binding protein [Anaerolineae bacterium]
MFASSSEPPTCAPTGQAIHLTGLSKKFGSVQALEGVSLEVADGEIYGLVGPDGAGKTTLIRLACGVLKPDAGSVSLCGFLMAQDTEQARAQVGYLAQRFAIYEDMTVMENLRFFAEVRGLKADYWKARARQLLDFVGLAEFTSRRAGQLSGGMKQKLGLALALISQPRVLLLDEPTTGVDPATRLDFWRVIIHLVNQENLAVLVSTPYMDEAARCTRIGFLRNGRLIREGKPRELRNLLSGKILELAGEPLPLLIQLSKANQAVENAQRFGNSVHLRVREGKTEETAQQLQEAIHHAGGTVTRLQTIEAQLEDVFIALAEEMG